MNVEVKSRIREQFNQKKEFESLEERLISFERCGSWKHILILQPIFHCTKPIQQCGTIFPEHEQRRLLEVLRTVSYITNSIALKTDTWKMIWNTIKQKYKLF